MGKDKAKSIFLKKKTIVWHLCVLIHGTTFQKKTSGKSLEGIVEKNIPVTILSPKSLPGPDRGLEMVGTKFVNYILGMKRVTLHLCEEELY